MLSDALVEELNRDPRNGIDGIDLSTAAGVNGDIALDGCCSLAVTFENAWRVRTRLARDGRRINLFMYSRATLR